MSRRKNWANGVGYKTAAPEESGNGGAELRRTPYQQYMQAVTEGIISKHELGRQAKKMTGGH